MRGVLSLRAPLLTVSLEGGGFTGCSVCDSEWEALPSKSSLLGTRVHSFEIQPTKV